METISINGVEYAPLHLVLKEHVPLWNLPAQNLTSFMLSPVKSQTNLIKNMDSRLIHKDDDDWCGEWVQR